MNASKGLAILLVGALVPAAASAQIVIDRLNEDDPSTPVAAKSSTNGASPEADEKEAEQADEEIFTRDELAKIHKVLLADLSAAHGQCLKSEMIRRPQAAAISGSATWTVSEKGAAKFKTTSFQISPDAFFESEKQKSEFSPKAVRRATEIGDKLYRECVSLESAKVGVKGKSGDVAVQFTIRWQGNKAVATSAQPIESDGGASVIEL